MGRGEQLEIPWNHRNASLKLDKKYKVGLGVVHWRKIECRSEQGKGEKEGNVVTVFLSSVLKMRRSAGSNGSLSRCERICGTTTRSINALSKENEGGGKCGCCFWSSVLKMGRTAGPDGSLDRMNHWIVTWMLTDLWNGDKFECRSEQGKRGQ